MKLFMANWWKIIFSKKLNPIKIVDSLSDIPTELYSDIYIVQNEKINKWVVFKCPNDCGRRVEVNLMGSKYPRWSLKIKNFKATIYPSIIVEGCNAHFWIEENKIFWAKSISKK